MTEIAIFAKNQTVDVELAGVERNRKGRIIDDGSAYKHNRYDHNANTILFVTLYQTTLSADVSFYAAYEIFKDLVFCKWGFKTQAELAMELAENPEAENTGIKCYVADMKLIRDVGSVWSFYLTLTDEIIITDDVYKIEADFATVSNIPP